ncbi:hypothetical protein CPT_Spivey_088 [Klebsiella phage Spivey]|uniref:Uncharacterized protein n=2 Tax=Sugarlandvirus sugarland TaxID=2560546 RepID=A0A2H4PGY9_9CAUD|nr:hypothetical protein FDJ18_gp155 [Klebsiella phage Sugarland]ATW61917.1 hypothetical protein CPT_Sugarland_090 [Klebsiella phage Sugarland]QBX06963.1 hypothetical protein CPT_Spivey_118 [Klebsiella phage Spivey]
MSNALLSEIMLTRLVELQALRDESQNNLAHHKQMVDTLTTRIDTYERDIAALQALFSVSAPDTLEQPNVSQPIEIAPS